MIARPKRPTAFTVLEHGEYYLKTEVPGNPGSFSCSKAGLTTTRTQKMQKEKSCVIHGIRMTEQYCNMKTASKTLDISVRTLRRLIAANGIPLYKVGHTYLVRESDLKMLPIRVYSIDEIADEMLRGD